MSLRAPSLICHSARAAAQARAALPLLVAAVLTGLCLSGCATPVGDPIREEGRHRDPDPAHVSNRELTTQAARVPNATSDSRAPVASNANSDTENAPRRPSRLLTPDYPTVEGVTVSAEWSPATAPARLIIVLKNSSDRERVLTIPGDDDWAWVEMRLWQTEQATAPVAIVGRLVCTTALTIRGHVTMTPGETRRIELSLVPPLEFLYLNEDQISPEDASSNDVFVSVLVTLFRYTDADSLDKPKIGSAESPRRLLPNKSNWMPAE